MTVHSDRVRRSQPVEMTPSMAYALVRNPRGLENREPLRIRAAVTALSELNDPNPTVIRRVRLGEAPPADPARSTEPPSRTGPRPTKPGEVRAHADRTTYRTLPRPGGRDAAVVAQVFGLLDSDAPVRRPATAPPEHAPDTPAPGNAPSAPGAGAPPATPSSTEQRDSNLAPAPGVAPSSHNGTTPPTGVSSPTGADGAGSPGAGAPAVRHRPAPAVASAGHAGEPTTRVDEDTAAPAKAPQTGPGIAPVPAGGEATTDADPGQVLAGTPSSAAAEETTAAPSPAAGMVEAPAEPKLRWWQRLFGRRTSKGCQMCGWRGDGPCPLGHR